MQFSILAALFDSLEKQPFCFMNTCTFFIDFKKILQKSFLTVKGIVRPFSESEGYKVAAPFFAAKRPKPET
jgi:hypothetical protein